MTTMTTMQPTWQTADGSIRLFLGDCLSVLPTLEAGSVDAVVTDIPYNISQEHGGLREIDYGEWDKGFRWEPAIAEFIRLADAWCIWCHQLQLSGILARLNEEGLSRPLFWVKPNPTVMNGQHHWLHGGEVCAAGKRRGAEFNLSCHRGWWLLPAPVDRVHPTQKPLAIISEQVAAYGERICDPFMGSGTTGVACAIAGKEFIGIERDPVHFATAVRRIEAELNRAPLFEKPPVIQRTLEACA